MRALQPIHPDRGIPHSNDSEPDERVSILLDMVSILIDTYSRGE